MHYACFLGKEEVVEFLIEEEKKIIKIGKKDRRLKRTVMPSFNIQDKYGYNPVFWTESSKIVELMLQFECLRIEERNGKPLLWECAGKGIVSEKIALAEKLKRQLGQIYGGTLPLEKGEHG